MVHDRVEFSEYQSEMYSEGCDSQRRLHQVVSEAVPLRHEVLSVVVVRCGFKGCCAGDRDAGRGEARGLGGVVAEQVDAIDPEVAEDCCGVGVVAGVDGQLELVGGDIRGESDAAAFVPAEVQQDAASGVGDAFECGGALCAAVAAP